MQFQNGNIIVEKVLAHESILTIIRNETEHDAVQCPLRMHVRAGNYRGG